MLCFEWVVSFKFRGFAPLFDPAPSHEINVKSEVHRRLPGAFTTTAKAIPRRAMCHYMPLRLSEHRISSSMACSYSNMSSSMFSDRLENVA